MMFPSNRVRIVVATKPVDFRKSHDGLAVLIKNELRKNARIACRQWMAVVRAENDAVDPPASRPAKPRNTNRGSLPKHLPRF